MIQIKGLHLTHKKDLRVILEKFDIVLNYGDKLAIIGEEGNGKSTLMKWLYAPQLVEDYIEAEGERNLGNERIGYLPQALPEKDKAKSLYEFFSEEDCFWNQTPNQLGDYAKQFGVKIEFFYSDQKVESLSGGERVKAQLIKLLMQEPTVLLLDEPSNDIDIACLELLERIIHDWKYIVAYISHDETLIENTANRIVHIEQIHRKTKSRFTVAEMDYQRYVAERENSFERQMKQALSERKEKQIRDEKYRRVKDKVQTALDNCSRQSPSVAKNLKDKMHAVKSMGKRFEKQDKNMMEIPEQESAIFFTIGNDKSGIPSGKTVLEYSLDALYSPDGKRLLSQNIFLRIRGAEKICIVGANGAGKTTFIRDLAEKLLNRTDLKVEYMPQNYEELLDFTMTPVDFLDKTGEKEERTKIRTFLGSLKYTADEMEHPISELSEGQKAKVLLAKMALSDANVLILDEPTRNFSPLSGPVIRKMIREFPGAVISISHDRKFIAEVCDKIYELKKDGLFERQESM
ncbi:ABC transporter ATP-binding protein [Clostridiales bacterium COT073_COT-073]|nr:ABC transporter ATP-binding protein [Clostridiales bacterium COT073_COT-073]